MSSTQRKPVDYDELFPGRFLKAADLKGQPWTLEIVGVELEDLPKDDGTEQPSGILRFQGAKKTLVLNSTNGQCIKAMFGREVQKWVGHRVTFVPETTLMGKPGGGTESVPCIRIQGSPELTEPMTVTIKLPRRKDTTRRLIPTGKQQPTPSQPDRQPGEDDT